LTDGREGDYTRGVKTRTKTSIAVAVALLSVTACGGKEEAAGGVTPDAIKAANGLVKPFDPWPAAEKKLVAKLGKPTKVDGIKHWWAAMSGDDCVGMYVENNKGQVGTVMHPDKFLKKNNDMYFKQCIAAVAK
jgi:hypothetical protein